ncbi:MAG: 50S ribosomal protein L13 [candidate division NC10 bacterium]|nr:50S ribosomal protein L13 [candidate division NC10 bacterium]
MKTYHPHLEEIQQRWYLVDAKDQILGRVASRIASVLRGKHKPMFAPNVDVGDFVVVVNAEKVILTGKKLQDKVYHWHTGYPGGLRSVTARKLLKDHPERVLKLAVKGMLPKNRLGDALLKKLKVYVGPTHPHQAQKPELLPLVSKDRQVGSS